MGTTLNLWEDAPIIMKYAYVKILFLTDKEKFNEQPILRKVLRGSTDSQDIYDAGVFYVNTRFNTNKPRHFKWEFTSEQGTVDDVFQLYPFKYNIRSNEPGSENDPRRRTNPVDTKLTDGVIVIAHHYNAFQKDKEWAGIRADDDSQGIRIVVDFSSIATLPDKDQLFETEPWGEMEKALTGVKEPLQVERIGTRIFSISYNNATKDDVLKLWWKINWNNLVLWQAFSEVKKVNGDKGRVIPRVIPTW